MMRPPAVRRLGLSLLFALGLATVPILGQDTGTVAPVIKHQFFTNAGQPCSGCLLHVYLAGTTTDVDTFNDADLDPLHVNDNPIELDAYGRADIFLEPGSYRFVLANEDDATIWDQDSVQSVPNATVNADVAGVAGEDLTAGKVVYLSDGQGSRTAGRWYLADQDFTYSSSRAPQVGMTVASIDTGDTGQIRLVGRVINLSGLTPGTVYYVSATAGALTSTAPVAESERIVGVADTVTSLVLFPNSLPPNGEQEPGLCNGRLTGTSGTAYTTTDVTATANVYWTPIGGNAITLYDGTRWVRRTFSEITISLNGLTASRPYDVFLYDVSGTVTSELTIWTNATTRATAVTYLHGTPVKSGTTTRRYVGTVYINATGGQTDDSLEKRYISNYCNRDQRELRHNDVTNSWTYSTAAFQQARADSSNKVEVMVGLPEMNLSLANYGYASNTNNGINFAISIGDGSATPMTNVMGMFGQSQAIGVICPMVATVRTKPSAGLHSYWMLEWSQASATTTFYGDNNLPSQMQAGLYGYIEG